MAPKTSSTKQGARTPKRAASKRASQRRTPTVSAAALPAEILDHFGADRVELVRQECLPDGANAVDLSRLLLEAKRLGADPLRGDVYLAAESARDGGAPRWIVVAKRDTLLRYAERHRSFAGHDEAAIYERDDFTHGDAIGDGRTLRERAGIFHFARNPFDAGKLVGAWCAVEVAGRPPVVFVARATEYLLESEVEAMDPDDPRRRFPDRYLVAKAMCWPLRLAFGLNDVVGAEELPDTASRRPAPTAPPTTGAAAAVDDPTDRALVALVELAAQHAPGKWLPADVRARAIGADDESRAALAHAIADDVLLAIDPRAAELAEFLDDEALDEDAREDAEAEQNALHDVRVATQDALALLAADAA